MTTADDLVDAVEMLEDEDALKFVQELIAQNKSPDEIFNALRKGMQKVGEKFAKKEYFLADLVYSAELFQDINKIIMPLVEEKESGEPLGKIVFGTVKHDIHDIGKDIVIALLRAEGFLVVDLGVDVPPEKFVEVIKKEKPHAVGLCGLLTAAIEQMKETVELIRLNIKQENIAILVGGGPIDESVCKYTGADDWAPNAVEAVKSFKKYID